MTANVSGSSALLVSLRLVLGSLSLRLLVGNSAGEKPCWSLTLKRTSTCWLVTVGVPCKAICAAVFDCAMPIEEGRQHRSIKISRWQHLRNTVPIIQATIGIHFAINIFGI